MRPFALLLLLCPAVATLAQDHEPVPKVIEHLLSLDTHRPSRIVGAIYHFLPSDMVPGELGAERQYFVSSDSGLFVKINGTGMLIRVQKGPQGLTFRRLDSTHFWGNDFDAHVFSWRDTVYSYGGYGFWQNNGMLRVYDPIAHGWRIKATDREIEEDCSFGGVWVDPDAGRFYIAHRYPINEGLIGHAQREVPADSVLWSLDLASGRWEQLGVLGGRMGAGFNTPWGNLADQRGRAMDFILYDILHNRKFNLQAPLRQRLEGAFNYVKPEIFYFVDSTFFLGSITLDRFDSVPMRLADYEDTGLPVFTAPELNDGNGYWTQARFLTGMAAGAILASLLFLFISMRNKKSKTPSGPLADAISMPAPPQYVEQMSSLPTKGKFSMFTQTELDLIRLIRGKSLNGGTATIDEVNHILGLTAKNEAVQKKNRSEVISSINQKWGMMVQNDQHLIFRRRSEFDGRFFEYYMAKDQAILFPDDGK